MAKGKKKTPKLLDIPTLPIVDLRIRALCAMESILHKKINLSDVRTSTLNHWCINYLRHRWILQYERHLKHKGNLHADAYIKIHEEVTHLIAAKYPCLAEEAHQQLLDRKNKDGVDR
jgi:hypothetical protein